MNTNNKDTGKNDANNTQEGADKTTGQEGKTIHTVNPFTGTEVDISPEDLEGIEKFKEAQTERD